MSEIPPPTVPPATPPPPGGGSYTPPPPPTGGAAPAGSDRTLMLVLSYVWLLALVPLTQKKDDAEIQWHAKNGLVLAVVMTAIGIIDGIFSWFFPFTSMVLSCIPCLIGVGYLVITIIAIMKAMNGDRLRIPVLTDYAEKL